MSATQFKVSDPVLPTVTLEYNVPATFPRVHVGILMYDNAEGTGTPVLGDSGDFGLQYKTVVTQQWETPSDATIDAATPETLFWEAPVKSIKVVPNTLVGVASYRIAFVSFA